MDENVNNTHNFFPCSRKKINLLEKFPEKKYELETYINSSVKNSPIHRRQSYLIACLHKAQGLFGYLPLEVQELVGKKLGLQQADVFGVISFYSYFTDKPVGKYKINICTGTACFVRGAEKIMNAFKEKLNIDEHETTKDMKFSLTSIRCVGACSLAPIVTINDKVYAKVTVDMVDKILGECV